jgi:hypothetical protein
MRELDWNLEVKASVDMLGYHRLDDGNGSLQEYAPISIEHVLLGVV